MPKTGSSKQPFYFEVVTTPTADTEGTTLALEFANQRYIFGRVSEGTQRAYIQRNVGLKKIHNIFLTGQTKWRHNGGLLGLVLTMAEVQQGDRENIHSDKRPPIHIYGPCKLLHTMACARRFIFRTSMPLMIHETPVLRSDWPSEPMYSDENIRVWTINLDSKHQPLDRGRERSGDNIHSDVIKDEQKLRKSIVKDMFDSDWRKDRLVETTFKEVQMPATVYIKDPQSKEIQVYNCMNMESAPEIGPDQTVLVRNPWPASLIGQLPPASNLYGNMATSYIVKSHTQRGAFDPKRARELHITPGPDFTKLTSGESVLSTSGQLVTPEMVLSPPQLGRGFAIFDLPNMNCVEDLEEKLARRPDEALQGIDTIVWVLDKHSQLQSSPFKRLMESLEGIQHIVAEPGTSSNYLAFDSSAASSIRLSQISPTNFPVPKYDNHDAYDAEVQSPIKATLNALKFLPARRGLKVRLLPTHVTDESGVPTPIDVSNRQSLAAMRISEPVQRTAGAFNTSSTNLTEPEIITLGTGSASPSKYRNVSATLLRMPDDMGNYLFDCGENTLGQLKRVFTASELDDILVNLRVVWISHLHADHHLGTISVLDARRSAIARSQYTTNRNVANGTCVMSEVNMLDFLAEYSSVEPFLSSSAVIPVVCSPATGPIFEGKPLRFDEHDLPFKSVQTVRVSHCHGAQAVSMTFTNGFKFSYSGDCRPSERFTEIGAGSDVLLHEATFESGMDGDAKAKKHSTTSEALGVALKMRAKNVVLTHFSQRYQKVPVLHHVKMPDEVNFEEGVQAEGPMAGPVDIGTDADQAGVPQLEDSTVINGQIPQLQPNGHRSDPVPAGPNSISIAKDIPRVDNFNSKIGLSQDAADMHICVAFDYMRVKVSEIKEMKASYPTIEAMFEAQLLKAEAEKQKARDVQEEITNRRKEDHTKRREANQQKQAKQAKGKNGREAKDVKGEGKTSTRSNGEAPGLDQETVDVDKFPDAARKRLKLSP